MPALLTRMSMRPSAFTVASRAASISVELRDVARDRCRPCRGRRVRRGRLVGQLAVAVPDRDRSARIQQPLDDRPADALRAAGDDGAASVEIDLVGHARNYRSRRSLSKPSITKN